MGFKYVMLEMPCGGVKRRVPIIFPDILVHADVAAAVQKLPMMGEAQPVSAGDIDLLASNCHGKSSTLNLQSCGDDDAETINAFPYFHGIDC